MHRQWEGASRFNGLRVWLYFTFLGFFAFSLKNVRVFGCLHNGLCKLNVQYFLQVDSCVIEKCKRRVEYDMLRDLPTFIVFVCLYEVTKPEQGQFGRVWYLHGAYPTIIEHNLLTVLSILVILKKLTLISFATSANPF